MAICVNIPGESRLAMLLKSKDHICRVLTTIIIQDERGKRKPIFGSSNWNRNVRTKIAVPNEINLVQIP